MKTETVADHPVTRGAICERGKLMPDHVHHPQRLNHPLKRKGEKGGGQWQKLTWDQALDEVAEKLSELKASYGAETLAFTHGTKRTYHWDCRRFFNLFGSPNTCGVNNVCMCPSYATEYATYGGMVMPGVMGAACIVIWGSNPVNSNPVGLYRQLVHARKQGTPIIVVDPRRTKEAEMADLWLQIRPGTDVALMLGWIRLIIEHFRQKPGTSEQAVRRGLAECIRWGTTTLGEIGQPNASVDPFEQSPLDTTVFFELIAPTTQRMAPLLDLAPRRLESVGASRNCRPGLSPHAPYSVFPQLLDAAVALSAAERVPLAFHLFFLEL